MNLHKKTQVLKTVRFTQFIFSKNTAQNHLAYVVKVVANALPEKEIKSTGSFCR